MITIRFVSLDILEFRVFLNTIGLLLFYCTRNQENIFAVLFHSGTSFEISSIFLTKIEGRGWCSKGKCNMATRSNQWMLFCTYWRSKKISKNMDCPLKIFIFATLFHSWTSLEIPLYYGKYKEMQMMFWRKIQDGSMIYEWEY